MTGIFPYAFYFLMREEFLDKAETPRLRMIPQRDEMNAGVVRLHPQMASVHQESQHRLRCHIEINMHLLDTEVIVNPIKALAFNGRDSEAVPG